MHPAKWGDSGEVGAEVARSASSSISDTGPANSPSTNWRAHALKSLGHDEGGDNNDPFPA